MTSLTVFRFDENSPVRVVKIDGEPWFVGKDLCDILDLSNSRMALERLDDDEKGVSNIYTPGGNQEMTIVSESGMYSLILTSRKPEAQAFKKWITSEVLPSIRKTGSYSASLSLDNQIAEIELTNAKNRHLELKIKLAEVEKPDPKVEIARIKLESKRLDLETAKINLERSRIIREKPPVAPIPASAPVDPMEKLKQDIAAFREQFKEKNGRYPRVREIQQKFSGRRIWKGNTRARVTADVVRAIMG